MSETTTEAPPAEQQGDPADKPLGEGGEKALKAEREARKAAEAEKSALQKQLEEINRANETALERAQREAQEAKAQVEAIPQQVADQLRGHLATIHNISEEQQELYLTSNDPGTLLKQAMGLVERTPTSPKPDLTQGGKGEPPALNSNSLEQALKNKLGIA